MTTSHTTLRAVRTAGLVGNAAATQLGGSAWRMAKGFAKMIGLSICNTSSVAITATVYVKDGLGNTYNLIYNTPIAVGATLIPAGPSDQYTVLAGGDAIFVSIAGAGGSADVCLSIEERAD